MPHEGISLRFDGGDHRIDFTDLVGRGIAVYGQQEVVKDLVAARLERRAATSGSRSPTSGSTVSRATRR